MAVACEVEYVRTTWNDVKDVKESYPVKLAEYTIENGHSDEPVFAWWVKFVMQKRDIILSKVKSKYWARTHKYGIRVPKDVRKSKEMDTENENTLWCDSIMLDMKNTRPVFGVYKVDKKELLGYQEIKCHFVFNIKLGEIFLLKDCLVGGGHITETPAALTYASVVS